MKWLFYVIVFIYMFYRAVYGKPEYLTVDPVTYDEDGFLKAGEHKTMNCKASNRNAKVEWIDPNGSVVKRIPSNRIFSQEHFVPAYKGRAPALVLTITKAEVQDSGVYQCHSGDNSKNVSLCVIEPSEFVDTLSEVTADIGRSITLSCQAKGNPEPNIVWNRNGEMITDEDKSGKYKIMTKYNIRGFEGLLTITSLTAEDRGVYSCVSFQDISKVEDCNHLKMYNITLNVNFPPVFDGGKDINVYGKFNQEVDIECSAEGFPTPTYRLFKELPDGSLSEYNQKQIKIAEDTNQAILTVVVNSTTLNHRFKCLATNDLGGAERYFTVLKTQRPSIINEVDIYTVTDTMVEFNVTWDEEVAFPLSAFDIQYIQDSNDDRKKIYSKDSAWRKSILTEGKIIEENEEAPEFEGVLTALTGLEEETSYWVRLRAVNEVGESPWSDPIFVSTSAAKEEPTTTDEVPVEPEPSINDNKVNGGTFYGIFFAGGILVVAFVCMMGLRLVK